MSFRAAVYKSGVCGKLWLSQMFRVMPLHSLLFITCDPILNELVSDSGVLINKSDL